MLAAATVIALPEIIRRAAIAGLGAATGRTVALASVDVSLRQRRIALRGLSITDRDGQPLASLDRVEARLRSRDLLRGHLHLVDVVADRPTVRIVRTGPAEFNVSDLFGGEKKRGGGMLAVTVDRFALDGGTVVVEDRTLNPARTWRIDAMRAEARDVSSVAGARPGVATLNAVAAGSPIALWVTDLRLDPLRLHATVSARDIDATLVGIYLPPASPLTPTAGVVNIAGTVRHDAASGSRIGFDVGFANVELHRPGQSHPFVLAPAVRLTVETLDVRAGVIDLGRLTLGAERVTLQDAGKRRWTADGIAIDVLNASSNRQATPGTATARATFAGASASVWVTNFRLAPVELHATTIVRNVDAGLLKVYLPPDRPVQPERGVVNASMQLDHDAKSGTRMTIDAGFRNVDLRLPAQSVTAESLRLLVEDVRLATGVVTVGRVGLTGELVTIEDRTVKPAHKWPVRNLAVEATRLSSRREDTQGVATLRATVAGAPVSVWATRVRIEPLALHATVMLRQIDVAVVRPYLPAHVPVELERGVVDASLRVDLARDEGVRVDLDARLTGMAARSREADGPRLQMSEMRVTVAEARRKGEQSSVGRFELQGRGSITGLRPGPPKLELERWHVAAEDLTWPVRAPARLEVSAKAVDRSEVSARGTVQLTKPLPEIAWSADVEAELTSINLEQFAGLAPATQGLSGRVRGTFAGTVAWAGTLTARMRGDASASRLALVEDGRTLVSARRVQAAAVDVQWPERVAVQQIRLTQPGIRLERNRQGALSLATRFAGTTTTTTPSPPATGDAPRRSGPEIAVAEVVVEAGNVSFADRLAFEPVLIDLPRVDATLRDLTWPARGPARIKLDAAMMLGGTVAVEGTVVAEPASVDLNIDVKGIEAASIQAYAPFRARVRGRLDARLTVSGPLTPALRLTAKGEAAMRNVTIGDAQRTLLTVAGIEVTGIDAVWPERVNVDAVRVRRSWALIERTPDGEFALRRLFEAKPAMASTPAAKAPVAAAPAAPPEFHIREAVFEDGAVTVSDAIVTPPARFDVSGSRLVVQDFVWPSTRPMKLHLTSPAPGGGKLDIAGTFALDPVRLDMRAVLDGVALAPAQPYLPIEGLVTGRVTGDLAFKMAAEPLAVSVTGQARVQRFRLSDGDRPVITVGRVETTGIDVDWPKRIAVQSVRFARPRLLIERDAEGDFAIQRLVTPRREPAAAAVPSTPGESAAPSAVPAELTIDVGQLKFERASARFVDHGTRPAYAEELNDVEIAITGLTTAPNRPVRFATTGVMPGGASLKVTGEGTAGDRPVLDLDVTLRDIVVPRANPYLDKYTSWTATRGRLSVSAKYHLEGTRLDARHDIVVAQLDVEKSEADDEVERRLGMPLGFLVAVMKNARGEIRLSLPVSGDVGTGTYEFREAVWGAVRAAMLRLVALPFSRIGSIFVSEDSKLTGLTIAPVTFEAGTTRRTPGTDGHLERVAAFLRDTPSANVALTPILTAADVEALKSSAAPASTEPTPADAVRALAAGRLDAVRDAILKAASIDPTRITAPRRRTPLVETVGVGRVEFDLRP